MRAERDPVMAKARTYVRDAAGRFASTPGGGKAKGQAKSSKAPAAKQSREPKPAATGRNQRPAAKSAKRGKAAPSRPDGKTKVGALLSGGNSLQSRIQSRAAKRSSAVGGQRARDYMIRKATKAEERRIREKGAENVAIINKRGKVAYRGTEGKTNEVEFGAKGKLYSQRSVVTHNHPSKGNPGYNAKVRGSRMTAGLSAADIRAAGNREVGEVRATGSTRTYSYKPEYKTVTAGGVKMRVFAKGDRHGADVDYSFTMGRQATSRRQDEVNRKFQDRYNKAKSQWWNPGSRSKAKKIKAAWERSKEAMKATEHYQNQLNAMRSLRDQGYNITSRRSRSLQTNTRAKTGKARR
jgi:hypothetical protein